MQSSEGRRQMDVLAFELATRIADRYHDGHVTIFRFTTSYRVAFGTPEFPLSCEDLLRLPSGETLFEAVAKALEG